MKEEKTIEIQENENQENDKNKVIESAKAENEAEVPAEDEDITLKVKKLEEQLLTMENEKKELKDKLLRVAADFDNYRKRVKKDMEDAKWRAQEEIFKELILVFDNLDRALLITEKDEEGNNIKAIVDGFKLVYKHFDDTMARFGLKRFSSKGEVFDPSIHEAIAQQVKEDVQPGIILDEYRKGYMLGERLLRPAMVVVSQAKPAKCGCEEKKEDSTIN